MQLVPNIEDHCLDSWQCGVIQCWQPSCPLHTSSFSSVEDKTIYTKYCTESNAVANLCFFSLPEVRWLLTNPKDVPLNMKDTPTAPLFPRKSSEDKLFIMCTYIQYLEIWFSLIMKTFYVKFSAVWLTQGIGDSCLDTAGEDVRDAILVLRLGQHHNANVPQCVSGYLINIKQKVLQCKFTLWEGRWSADNEI